MAPVGLLPPRAGLLSHTLIDVRPVVSLLTRGSALHSNRLTGVGPVKISPMERNLPVTNRRAVAAANGVGQPVSACEGGPRTATEGPRRSTPRSTPPWTGATARS